MIPLKLQLKNFLSYGSKLQTIDFGSYPLICLSGKNGHGKSALLDAMTWALWGQARKTTGTIKPDAQLLRLGQTSMMVIFDFAFNDQTYRIRREFALTRNGNPYAVLEFGILEPETETIKPLTEKTIRSTQKKIETLLGLDFDTFVNSAFLRQGHANEFSKKSPKDRKEILASILQLQQYEVIKKAAQEKTKHAQTEIHHLEKMQERIAIDLEQKDELQHKKQQLTAHLEQITQEENSHQKTESKLEQEKQLLAEHQQQYSVFIYQSKELKTKKESLEKQLLELFAQWRTSNKQQRLIADPQKLATYKQKIATQINTLQQQQQQALELKEHYLKEKEQEQQLIHQLHEQHLAVLKKMEVMIERLQAEQKHHETVITDLRKRKTAYVHEYETVQKEHAELTQKLTNVSKQQTLLDKTEQQFEKRKTHYHNWVARANMLSQEQVSLAHKKEWTQESSNPSCPLCEQNLSASRKRFLQTKFAKLATSLHHRLTRLSRIIPKLKNVLIEQHKTIENLKKEREQHTLLLSKQQDLEKTTHKLLQSIAELKKECTDNQTKQSTIAQSIEKEQQALTHAQKHYETELHQNKTYQLHKQVREQLEKKLKEITYNPEQHKKLLTELQQLQAQEQKAQELSAEIINQQQRTKEIQQLCATLKNVKQKNSALNEQLKTFADLEKKKKELATKQEEHQTLLKRLQKQKEELLQEKGRLENEQKKLEQLAKEHKQQSKKITSLQETSDDYQTLATALGKDGIQALLIEDALPEIEQEANELLALLTNNQAHIIIESLRDLKKGGTKETLDIKISDPMGIRPYELFSGGEAFRIDFALRIAISKLLARRAGTSLQTLIIDEGFGSQDEEGLALLMDAIYKIQDNFTKIIIVSHLTAMKDQFPVHFFVQKGAQGSTVEVIQQG